MKSHGYEKIQSKSNLTKVSSHFLTNPPKTCRPKKLLEKIPILVSRRAPDKEAWPRTQRPKKMFVTAPEEIPIPVSRRAPDKKASPRTQRPKKI